MDDLEYGILDELYFYTAFAELRDKTSELAGLNQLKECLWGMLQKGWLLCFEDEKNECLPLRDVFEKKYADYYYLASKKGLLLHNSA